MTTFKTYIVTGTPGAGKTTFAKHFAKKNNLEYISGLDIIEITKLAESKDEDGCIVVDEKKFAKICEKIITLSKKTNKKSNDLKGIIIDSHLSHYINPKYVDLCFVTECDIKILKKRLTKRKYSPQKIRDNLDSEIFKICRTEAKESGHKIKVIDTSKNKK